MRIQVLISTLASLMIATASPAPGEETIVAYRDNFSGVKGFSAANANGRLQEDDLEKATRQVYTFMSDEVDGELKIRLLEDDQTEGPDGKPGVLSMSYVKVSNSALFSGFVYDGRLEDPITLQNFEGEVGDAQLKQVKVSFRYKADNPDESKIGAEYNCRFEPVVDDPYEYRIDFGILQATGKWRTFERTLSSGENQFMFRSAVNRSPKPPFRLVWGQEGEIISYDNGDTLLIDDVRITIVK